MIGASARNGAPSKSERRRAILELVRTRTIRTQDDLVAALRRRRVPATQATVSRDIRDLGLLRVHDDAGPRYVAAAAELDAAAASERVHRALVEHVQALEFVDLLGVMHTAPGSAPLVAAAIDAGRFEELAGSVAGDDTVLMVARSRPAAQRLHVRLKHMMERP